MCVRMCVCDRPETGTAGGHACQDSSHPPPSRPLAISPFNLSKSEIPGQETLGLALTPWHRPFFGSRLVPAGRARARKATGCNHSPNDPAQRQHSACTCNSQSQSQLQSQPHTWNHTHTHTRPHTHTGSPTHTRIFSRGGVLRPCHSVMCMPSSRRNESVTFRLSADSPISRVTAQRRPFWTSLICTRNSRGL